MAQEPPQSIEPSALDALATRYTAAWNSGSPEAVAVCYAPSGRSLRVIGWEEWEVDADLQVTASRGWFDAADYARQTGARPTNEAS